jgi:hypothetical protein
MVEAFSKYATYIGSTDHAFLPEGPEINQENICRTVRLWSKIQTQDLSDVM